MASSVNVALGPDFNDRRYTKGAFSHGFEAIFAKIYLGTHFDYNFTDMSWWA